LQRNTRVVRAAYEAVQRGFQPIPLLPNEKRPRISGWVRYQWPQDVTLEEVQEKFDEWGKTTEGLSNLGVVVGELSGGLLDVDLDHYRTARLKDYFLPPTSARSGRPGKPNSHYWYIAEAGTLPGLRKHLMPRVKDENDRWKPGPVIVELRSTGGQTAIPPSVHPSGESYSWVSEPWGGADGPAVVNGRRLAVQVATLALAAALLDSWPSAGVRHDAYLALAGGLLRDGDSGVHPYWGDRGNAAMLIRALADVTLDEDGAENRESESIGSTMRALQAGKPVVGFGRLAELIGDEEVRQIRILIGEVEAAAGVVAREAGVVDTAVEGGAAPDLFGSLTVDPEDPLGKRSGSWEPVDLEPFLSGRVQPVMPTVLVRDDGQALLYPGRVNMLYGSSESAKSWIALFTCLQVMAAGERTMYLDFEDDPENTLDRLRRMGAGSDDLAYLFTYIRPEDPIAAMQRDRWGNTHVTKEGTKNLELFAKAMETNDPKLVVADGMTVLYGLHGLDSNDAVSTDIITGWLKKLTRNGRTTVIIIDHKQAMVQGAMLQVWPVAQPMPDAVGEVELIVLKDRPGQVRKISAKTGQKSQLAARIIIDSTVPDVTTLSIQPPPTPASQQAQSAKLAAQAQKAQMHKAEEDQLLVLFGDVPGVSKQKKDLWPALQVSNTTAPDGSPIWDKDEVRQWEAALDRLVDKNWLYTEGKTRNFRYTLALGQDNGSSSSSSSSDTISVDLTNKGTD
jgi:hypothetical protein